MKNDSDKITKKVKKINKIKDQLAQLRAKLKASEDQQTSFSSKPKFKKIKAKTQQSKNENLEARVEKKKAKVQKKKKEKEEKKKQARIVAEAKKKAEEEAKKKEEDLKRTYEEELEEQLTEEEITGFQLEKIDMDRMCNKVCEIIAGYETQGTLQSELWKKLKLSSRDGSRLALKLERMGGPCLTCPVVTRCSLDGEISPRTCQWIEDWVMIELKNK